LELLNNLYYARAMWYDLGDEFWLEAGMVRRIRYRGEPYSVDMVALRRLERLRNFAAAIEVRDNPGDGSAAAKKVRLDAIRRIDPKACKRGLKVEG
jgi:hypothetical protein